MLPFLQSQLAGSSAKGVIDLCLDHKLIAALKPEKFTKIEGLDLFPDLRCFSASMHAIQDIDGLKVAPNLESLDLSLNEISDIDPIFSLSKLNRLHLSHNEIAEIGDFSALKGLLELDLGFNQISDISALFSLDQLETLILNGNRRLGQLNGLPANLSDLHLSQCFVSDFRGILGLKRLETLSISPGSLKLLEFLSDLPSLHSLHLNAKRLSATMILPPMQHLKTIRIRHAQQVLSLGGFEKLPNLSALEISNSLLESPPLLEDCSSLVELEINFSPLQNLNGIAAIATLKRLVVKGTSLPLSCIQQLARERPDLEIEF